MQPIEIPKGLENFIPWGRGFDELKRTYPHIQFSKSQTRKSDGVRFVAGNWVRLNNGEEVRIIAFDIYSHPAGRVIKRAVYAICLGFSFVDLDEWNWLDAEGNVIQEKKNKKKNGNQLSIKA